MTEPKPPYLHRIQVIVEIVVAVSAVAAVVAALRSAREARRSANESARSADNAWQMFELQRRPYMKVEHFDVTNYDRGTLVFQSIIRIRNIGQGAATS